MRHAHRIAIIVAIVFFLFIFFPGHLHKEIIDLDARQRKFPLAWKHLHLSRTTGGGMLSPKLPFQLDQLPISLCHADNSFF
jgi:hypothetical protein